MNGFKSLFASKTFWGTAIAFVALILNATGKVNIDQAMQGQALALVTEIGGVAGSALALYGRVKATKQIG